MTAPPRAEPKSPAQRTALIEAPEASPAEPAARPAAGTAMMERPAARPTSELSPATLREENPAWQRAGNTELGEPPVMDTLPPAAPPAPLAPPVAFAPLPTPNVPVQHATPPINAAPGVYGAAAYYAPRRPRGGGGMWLIGAGLFGFVLLLGAAIAVLLWMRDPEEAPAPAIAASSAPVEVAPEVATVEPATPEPPVVEQPIEPTPAPKATARKKPAATAAPTASPAPTLPEAPSEPGPAQTTAPGATPTPTATETAPSPPAPGEAEPLPPAPAPRRRIPRRLGQ
ncbi:MAG TPA: hypothetical protein VK509_05785 [Polyangiales bacterium]|nr:hypothetical protein [Polyangiales bacterium]